MSSQDTPKTTLNPRKCRGAWVRFVASERAARADSESRVTQLSAELCLVTALLLLPLSNAAGSTAVEQKEIYKLYSHTKLLNDKQYQCLVKLWERESRWDPTANNPKSSAYGIPQLLKSKERNPFKQIDKGLAYITKRYQSVCSAYHHHLKVGHY